VLTHLGLNLGRLEHTTTIDAKHPLLMAIVVVDQAPPLVPLGDLADALDAQAAMLDRNGATAGELHRAQRAGQHDLQQRVADQEAQGSNNTGTRRLGVGWLERYWVERRWGPYLRLRWREGQRKKMKCIGKVGIDRRV
jgi:hypothetical protein